MHLSVGYSGQYRRTAWTPVRVTLQNRTSATIDGTVEIPEQSNGSNYPGPVQPLYSVYQAPVVVPGGVTARPPRSCIPSPRSR